MYPDLLLWREFSSAQAPSWAVQFAPFSICYVIVTIMLTNCKTFRRVHFVQLAARILKYDLKGRYW